jgi:hypothetical protein
MNGNPTDQVEIPESLWQEFIPRIKSGLISEYNRLEHSGNPADQNVDWMKAFLQYLDILERPLRSRTSWLRENVTGLMVIATLMALAFGILGAMGFMSSNPATKDATAGFLDIAKLFAGAVVGAAGATAIVKR